MQIKRTLTPDNPPSGLLEGQLAVELASDPPNLWVGVPTSIDPSGRILLNPESSTTGVAGVASFNGRTGAVNLTAGDVTGAGGATLASPTFTASLNLAPNTDLVWFNPDIPTQRLYAARMEQATLSGQLVWSLGFYRYDPVSGVLSTQPLLRFSPQTGAVYWGPTGSSLGSDGTVLMMANVTQGAGAFRLSGQLAGSQTLASVITATQNNYAIVKQPGTGGTWLDWPYIDNADELRVRQPITLNWSPAGSGQRLRISDTAMAYDTYAGPATRRWEWLYSASTLALNAYDNSGNVVSPPVLSINRVTAEVLVNGAPIGSGGGPASGLTVGSLNAPANPLPGHVWTTPDAHMYVWNGDEDTWIQVQ